MFYRQSLIFFFIITVSFAVAYFASPEVKEITDNASAFVLGYFEI
jgi:hypothetical protein